MAVVAPVNQLGTGYFYFLVDGVGEGRRERRRKRNERGKRAIVENGTEYFHYEELPPGGPYWQALQETFF